MKNVPFSVVVVLVVALRAGAAADRPNILFIFSDDHGEQAISAYGSRINETPNIDRIAAEGMRFDRCFVTNAICAPSRAVILTGRHSHANGLRTNADIFDGSQTTFPQLLQAAGYQTAMIGKWHLKSPPTGFGYHEILVGQGPYYNPTMIRNGTEVAHTGYTTDIITDLALAWLRGRDADRPFLLMCQHKAPHRNWQPGPAHLHDLEDVEIPEPPTLFDDWAGRSPASTMQEMTIAEHLSDFDLKLDAPKNLTDEQRAAWDAAYEPRNEAFGAAQLAGDDLVRWKYQRYVKDYLRCVASLDDGIGRLLEFLDETGLSDDTVVVYASDQGWFLGEHGWYDKRWMYEESLRIPLLVRWPGVVAGGSDSDALVQNLDFAPTFLEMAGIAIPEAMQGASLLSVLRGVTPPDWRSSIYYHYYENPGAHSVPRHEGVRTDRWKLINFYRIGAWELYDLESDPDEMRNLIGDRAHAATAWRLFNELRRVRALYEVPDVGGGSGRAIDRTAE